MTMASTADNGDYSSKPSPLLRPGYLDRGAQEELLTALREVIAGAPLFAPRMPKSGRPFTVRMSNCGPLGWISDEAGYRYQPTHPVTGRPWPPMPEALLAMWDDLSGYPHPPEACLINFYGPDGQNGSPSGSQRKRLRGARGVAFAR
jgi:alkylated DNA repair protein (DNA oxidative demethylase)